MSKWKTNILIISLIILNIILLWRNYSITINNNSIKSTSVSDNKVLSHMDRWSLLGENFNLELKSISDDLKLICDKKKIKIMILFTTKGCNSCLREEVLEWKKLKALNSNCDLVPINIDTDRTDVLRFTSTYEISFPIYHYRKFKKYLPNNVTARIILLNRNNYVINFFDAKSGVKYERAKIYSFINDVS